MKSRILLLLALLTLNIGSVWAQTVTLRPIYVSTTGANSGNEAADKICDNNGTNTKWGQGGFDQADGTRVGGASVSVILRVDNSVLKAYTLWTGNDTGKRPGRRCKDWTLEGSNSVNGEWTTIDTKTNAELTIGDKASTKFDIENTATYSYYRLSVSKIVRDNAGSTNGTSGTEGMFELSDIMFDVEGVSAITFNVKKGTEVVYTEQSFAPFNSTWTPNTTPDHVTYTTNSFSVGEEGSYTFETQYTSTFPYEFSTEANPKWYAFKMRYSQTVNKRGFLYYDAASTKDNGWVRETENNYAEGGKYYWALVGTEFGFKFINYAVGKERYMTNSNGMAFNNTGTEFVPVNNGVTLTGNNFSTLSIKVKGTEQTYLNDVNEKLGTWDDGRAKADVGSQVELVEISELESYFDPAKTYRLRSEAGTYLKFTNTVNNTAISYENTHSTFFIERNSFGYQFNEINGKRIALGANTWSASSNGSYDWGIEPAGEENAYYIYKHLKDAQAANKIYLGNQDNQNAGTGIYTDQTTALKWYIEEYKDVADLQAKIDAAMTSILADEVGYPDRTNPANTDAINAIWQFQTTKFGSPVTADYYDEANDAYKAVLTLDAVNLPKNGKAYYFVNHQMVSNTNTNLDGKKWMMKYNDDHTLGTVAYTGQEPGAENIFICRKVGEKYTFVTKDGYYLRHYSADHANSLSESYEAEQLLNIEKHTKESNYVIPTKDKFFGFVAIRGKRSDSQPNACIIVRGDNGSYNNTDGMLVRYNSNSDQYSTAWRMVEVENPNKVKLTCPASPAGESVLNYKYVGTFSAPYAVELSEGIEAYYATKEGDVVTFHQIDGQVVPKNTGVLLYGPEKTEAVNENALPAITTKTVDGNIFSASNAGTVTMTSNDYILANGTNGVGFYRATGTLGRNKAYLNVVDAARLTFAFEEAGVDTAIESIAGENGADVVVYDLAGRKLNGLQRGINIVNGKKVIR